MKLPESYHRELGEILGFPGCCVEEFITILEGNYLNTWMYKEKVTKISYEPNGYVPCWKCWENSASEHAAIINSRRDPSLPRFPEKAPDHLFTELKEKHGVITANQ